MAWEVKTKIQELWMMLHVLKPQVGNCLAKAGSSDLQATCSRDLSEVEYAGGGSN